MPQMVGITASGCWSSPFAAGMTYGMPSMHAMGDSSAFHAQRGANRKYRRYIMAKITSIITPTGIDKA